jgi:hypothetical protein
MFKQTIYINQMGLDLCPKEENYREKLSSHDSLQNKILRSLFGTNPKNRKPVEEVISFYSAQGYKDAQVKDMIKYCKYAGFVTISRSLTL